MERTYERGYDGEVERAWHPMYCDRFTGTKLHHYYFQLAIYRVILERAYGLKINRQVRAARSHVLRPTGRCCGTSRRSDPVTAMNMMYVAHGCSARDLAHRRCL